MKNKNGFTLTELIVVIVLLAILIIIAVPSYMSVMNGVKKTSYDNKIELIKTAAVKYGNEKNITDISTIYVKDLVELGYLAADGDSQPYITSPIDGSSMDCYLVNLVYENNTYSVNVKENDSCDIILSNTGDDRVTIYAYPYSKEQKKILGSNINTSNNIINWTNNPILLSVVPNQSSANKIQTEDIIGYSYSFNGVYEEKGINSSTSSSINENYDNTYLVDASTILEGKVTIGIITKTATFTNYVTVKIDKEPPTLNASASGNWNNLSSTTKTINIVGTDGSGSGIKAFSVSKTPITTCQQSFVYKTNDGKYQLTNQTTGTYYICAIDNAGNVTTSPKVFKLSNVDNTAPSIKITSTNNPAPLNGWSTSAQYKVEYSDNESGMKSIRYCISLNGVPCTPNINPGETSGSFTVVLPERAETQSLIVTAVDNIGNQRTSYGNSYRVDASGPNIWGGTFNAFYESIGPAGASDPQSGVLAIYYYVSSSPSIPSVSSPGWITRTSFPTNCGTTYYLWTYAKNNAGLNSSIRYVGSSNSKACCTPPSGPCGNGGEVNNCNGVVRVCRCHSGDNYRYWEGTSGAGSGGKRRFESYCDSNGARYNSGGGVYDGTCASYWLSLNGPNLDDYCVQYVVGNHHADCRLSTYKYCNWE